MATMLADEEVLRLFSAIYNNDLTTVKGIVQGGLDPKHVQFVIRKFHCNMNPESIRNIVKTHVWDGHEIEENKNLSCIYQFSTF